MRVIAGLLSLIFLATAGFAGTDATRSTESLFPMPPAIQGEVAKIILGKALFQDKRLSRDNTISCESCHNLNLGGADGRVVSVGVGAALGDVNAPTVFNSGFNFRQFWDGRASTLEEQVDGPLQNAVEMGSNWPQVIQMLSQDEVYRAKFKMAYGEAPNQNNVKNAIASFERALTTPNSPFDKYLRGDELAISKSAKLGYEKFKSYGCVSCHQGVNIGGNMYQTLGVMGDYFKDRGNAMKPADYGRFNVTKREADKFVFRVPSLRNVSLTAPYFHDGSQGSLAAAVKTMARYQLGLEIKENEVKEIVAFLETLTGETPDVLRFGNGAGK